MNKQEAWENIWAQKFSCKSSTSAKCFQMLSPQIWLCSCEVTNPKENCSGCYSIRIIKTEVAAGMRNVTRNVYSWVDKRFSMSTQECSVRRATRRTRQAWFFLRPHNYWSVSGETRQLSETQAAAGWSHCHTVLMQLIELWFVFVQCSDAEHMGTQISCINLTNSMSVLFLFQPGLHLSGTETLFANSCNDGLISTDKFNWAQ